FSRISQPLISAMSYHCSLLTAYCSLFLPDHQKPQAEPEGFPEAPQDAEGGPQGEAQVEAQGQKEVASLLDPGSRGDEESQGGEQHGQGVQTEGQAPTDGVAHQPEDQIDLRRMEQPAQEKEDEGQDDPSRIFPIE